MTLLSPSNVMFSDASGNPKAASAADPLPVTLGGSSSTVSTNITQAGSTTLNAGITANGALPVQQLVGASPVSSTNPEPVSGAVSRQVTSVDWSKRGTLATGSLTATAQAAPAANLFNTSTDLTLSWTATTNAVTFSVKDGAGGTSLFDIAIPAGVAGQISMSWGTPKTGTAATLTQVATTDPGVAGTITWSLGGTVVG